MKVPLPFEGKKRTKEKSAYIFFIYMINIECVTPMISINKY